jgi:radical SAM family uncharacterized protein
MDTDVIIVSPTLNIMANIEELLFQVSKPARYTGGEWNSIVKKWDLIPIRVALAFPDIYEIGMSNLAIQILYEILNKQPDVLAERVFAPWVDMEEVLRSSGIPLYSLETKHPLKEFDIIGFSLGYELTYTNVLNMLDLAGIPVLSKDRTDRHPLIVAGGSCCLNPEPMSDFIDVFFIGEAEESLLEFIDTYRHSGKDRKQLLASLSRIPGIYIPDFYRVEYNSDGTVKKFTPDKEGLPGTIERRIFFAGPGTSLQPVVPFIEVVHDRAMIEIQRGCSRGCRFCQAGMIYRPIRELSHERVINDLSRIIDNCGYSEASLVSLSTGDYHDISGLVNKLKSKFNERPINISLPSLRLDKSSIDLIESLPRKRKTTLTFAPEAGSVRLRRAINKNVTEELIMDTFTTAFQKGWLNLKLYFMIGLPTETYEDVEAIVQLVGRILKLGAKNRRPGLRINVSTFVPKAHTPCQWLPQDKEDEIIKKQDILRRGLSKLKLRFSWQDTGISQLEAALSRGDRRLGAIIHRAWQTGCRFDTWSEHFNFDKWLQAFNESGFDISFYAHRERSLDEILPWQHIDTGVTISFLKRELEKIREGVDTGDCRNEPCNSCGLQRWSEDCRSKPGK